MPTYEYACTKCGQHVEVFQRFSEPPLTTCGVCGGPLRKIFHPAAIVFKGSGFYAPDSRSRPKADGAGGAESTPAAASGQRSESKPASGDGASSSKDGSTPPSAAKAATGSAKEKTA
jgi:putative FmdB family regulatory protein